MKFVNKENNNMGNKISKTSGQSPVPKKRTEKYLTFFEALKSTLAGKMMRRRDWKDDNEFGLIQDGYLRIFRNGKYHNWILTDGDLLANDWEII